MKPRDPGWITIVQVNEAIRVSTGIYGKLPPLVLSGECPQYSHKLSTAFDVRREDAIYWD